jgi:hypothetical protein
VVKARGANDIHVKLPLRVQVQHEWLHDQACRCCILEYAMKRLDTIIRCTVAVM